MKTPGGCQSLWNVLKYLESSEDTSRSKILRFFGFAFFIVKYDVEDAESGLCRWGGGGVGGCKAWTKEL
jgi:hypothetical protein